MMFLISFQVIWWWYVMPLVWGRGLRLLMTRKSEKKGWERLKFWKRKEVEEVIEDGVFDWAMGGLAYLGVIVLMKYGLGSIGGYFGLVWLVSVLMMMVNLAHWPRINLKTFGMRLAGLGLVVILAGLVTWWWRYKSPYPLNWDWYQHQSLMSLIEKGKFSLLASQMSNTFGFNSYPPTFHLLGAIAQFPAKLTPEYVVMFWKVASFWHFVVVGVASFWVGKVIGGSKWVGMVAMVMGIFWFDSSVSFTNLFWLPQTSAATIFAMMWARMTEEGYRFKWGHVASIVMLPLMHYVVGGLAVVILVAVMGQRWLKEKGWKGSYVEIGVAMVLLAAIGGVMLSYQVDLSELNQGEAGKFMYSLEEKREKLEQVYGYGVYLLLPLGVVAVWRRRTLAGEWGLLVLVGLMAVMVSNFPYVLKFFTLGRFLLHALMASGLWLLAERMRWGIAKSMVVIGLGGVMMGMMIVNFETWKTGLWYQGEYTHIADEDIEMARLIQQRYGQEGVLLISDPSTQFIWEGLSGVDSAGGAYMPRIYRELLSDGLNQDAEQLAGRLRLIGDPLYRVEKRVLVISGRTFAWLEAADEDKYYFHFNIWSPRELSLNNWEVVSKIASYPEFELVFASSYAAIIELK